MQASISELSQGHSVCIGAVAATGMALVELVPAGVIEDGEKVQVAPAAGHGQVKVPEAALGLGEETPGALTASGVV